MPSITKYPQTITQIESGKVKWNNTNNLKSNNNNHASTDLIKGTKTTENKPKRLEFTNFNFNLPVGAEVTKIQIEYSYRKRPKTTKKYPAISGPTIYLLGTKLGEYKYPLAGDGASPTNDNFPTKNSHRTWDGKEVDKNKKVKYIYTLPTRKQVNSSSFGVAFQFPKNTNDNEGYLDFKIISITLTYKIPSYSLSISAQSEEEDFIKDVPFYLYLKITNKQLLKYNPTIEINVPSGIDLESVNAEDFYRSDFYKSSDTKYVWIPKFSYGISERIGDMSLIVQCISHTTGDKVISVTETYTNTTQSAQVHVIPQPISSEDIDFPPEQTIYAIQGEKFTVPLHIPKQLVESDTPFYLFTDKEIKKYGSGSIISAGDSDKYMHPSNNFDENGDFNGEYYTEETGIINLYWTNQPVIPSNPTFIVKVVPVGYTIPRVAILKLSEEVAGRFGDGFNYVVSGDLQINCLRSNISLYHDYYRNFRIGVVNNIEETDSRQEIFDNCNHFTSAMTVLNDFETKEVEFTYNKDYPIYIIFCGNYSNNICNLFELEFSNLNIIEEGRDDGTEDILFPVPIKNIISEEEGSVSLLPLPKYANSNNLIFYDFGIKENFESGQTLSIRGIGIKITSNVENNASISARLISPSGFVGERSIISSSDNILGGRNDRWGFTISELENLEDFNLELQINNISTESTEIYIEKVELIVYYTFYDSYVVDWFIELENMAGLNAFLENVEIPEGLKTKTKYLSVEGTDTNEAYRQNIQEKEITVEFEIDECSIKESIATLQDISELLMTERDNLYRPIPKRVEFSHYPDIYWEYILEDPIDAKIKEGVLECKVKLTVPAGTAYSKNDISTGKSGFVRSLAKVNPIIVVSPYDEHIEIVENMTNQKFALSYDYKNGDLLEIDCKNRNIFLHRDDDSLDITVLADINCDWFLLQGQFLFEETGCIIQSVTYTERR